MDEKNSRIITDRFSKNKEELTEKDFWEIENSIPITHDND